ncbi:Crp/Fnr family transcriptional regulator [Nocardia sp. NPDC005366]|uniref:Crp/Fnr family transcriptional regulator n=1 Tax=Nocardia sp. NPDC005366 TaxID=3156878 RepID=UPI0033A2C55E
MARLTLESGRELLGLTRPQRVPAGTVLISQGDERQHVLLLRSDDPERSACVKITADSRSGKRGLLGIRVSGDVVGELAALRGAPRMATVTTCTDTVVHTIAPRDFLEFLNSRTDAWEALCRMIADRLEWANRRRLDFAGYEVSVRLARVLLDLAERHGGAVAGGYELGVRLSQTELGALIGAREDTVSSAMRQLRADGLVVTAYRTVTITDFEALRVFADDY